MSAGFIVGAILICAVGMGTIASCMVFDELTKPRRKGLGPTGRRSQSAAANTGDGK